MSHHTRRNNITQLRVNKLRTFKVTSGGQLVHSDSKELISFICHVDLHCLPRHKQNMAC